MSNFTVREVMLAEVEYSLEEFWSDLGQNITGAFQSLTKEQCAAVQHIVYQVLYFTFIGYDEKTIEGMLKLPGDLTESILKHYLEKKEMLEAVIMSQFIKNLNRTHGLLSDGQNLELVNAHLRAFHNSHNL